MKLILFSLLLTLVTGNILLYSQNSSSKEIIIDGVIISKEDNKPVPFVHVVNINTKQGVASNFQGRFTLNMKTTDSLIFSAIGFDKFVFELKEDIDATRLDITIEMNTNSMELAPVQIFAYRDVRTLKQAILELDVATESDNTRIQVPGFYYGSRKEVEPTVLQNPVSFLYSKVSKRAKDERKYKRLEVEYDAWRNSVIDKYNPILVQEITGLSEEEIDKFMLFCKIDDRFVKLSTQYQVVVAINKCLEEYLGDIKVDLDNN